MMSDFSGHFENLLLTFNRINILSLSNDDTTVKEWILNITAISFDMIFARDILENAWQQL